MKALQVDYDQKSDTYTLIEAKSDESWADVCERFDHDVHRLRSVASKPPYTGLYECFDDDNKPAYFLVEEDARLKAMRHKVFLSKLGR